MVIVVTNNYRPEQAEEVAKRFFQFRKNNPTPGYLKEIGPLFITDHDKGLEAMTLFEGPNEKLAEALLWIGKVCDTYRGIPGHTIDFRPWMTMEEALKITGIQP
jgi:hypothetical protein